MGQPVTVIEKQSPRPGVVRYEINRSLTGMGHEFYTSAPDPLSERPVDELARRIFAAGKAQSVHVNSNIITIQLDGDARGVSYKQLIEELFTFYRQGVRVPTYADFGYVEPVEEPEA